MRFATTSAIVLALLAPLPVRAQLSVTPAVSWSGKKIRPSGDLWDDQHGTDHQESKQTHQSLPS